MSRYLMFVVAALLAMFVSGCLVSAADQCDDGSVCPGSLVCDNSHGGCVLPDQVEDCIGKEQFGGCAYMGVPNGTCDMGVCVPSGCGNNLVEPDEMCDDGNVVAGDGCSADCVSSEMCGNGQVDFFVGESCDDANSIRHDGCAPECKGERPTWSEQTARLPPARTEHEMVYDSSRGLAFVFGGIGDSVDFGDAWQWNGRVWTEVDAPNPTPIERFRHGIAFDAARRQIVLFGGQTSSGGLLNDTWVFDGANWTQLEPVTRPPAMAEHAMVYDSARQRIVLAGGFDNNGAQSDTWQWDGANWERLNSLMTPPMGAQAMAYDPTRDRITMLVGNGALETWEFDGTNWAPVIPINSPPTGAAANLVFDTTRGRVVHLESSDPLTLWEWTGATWESVVTTGAPGMRVNSAWIHDGSRGRNVLFGGSGGGLSDETFELVGTTWIDHSGPPETGPQGDVATTYDNRRGTIIGYHRDANWEWDDGWIVVEPNGQQPPRRSQTSLAYHVGSAKTVLFGGRAFPGSTALGDTWELDRDIWTPHNGSSPPARRDHAMSTDTRRDRVVMFGGSGASPLADTWEWDGNDWSEVATTGPSARFGHGLAFDPRRGVTVLFGGFTDDGTSAETWEWDGTSWSQAAPLESPPALYSARLTYNVARGVVTLFGGVDDATILRNDTWEYDGTTWRALTTDDEIPLRRASNILVYSAKHTAFFVAAGFGGLGTIRDLWSFRFESGTPSESCTFGFDTDRDGLVGCDDPDCWSVCTPLCFPGASCDSGPSCGDGQCDAMENCRICSDDCGECPAICGDLFCDPGESSATCPGDC